MINRILMVEDELLIARDIEFMLKANGFEVIGIASTADHAVQLTRQYRPDLIIMDIILKEERTGIEGLKTSRRSIMFRSFI